MVMKKLGMFAVFLFLMVLSLGVISGVNSCSIKDRAFCTGDSYVVMGLSDSTNAHGELWNQENYEYALCCNFGTGDRECSSHLHPVYGDSVSANKIIGLSSITNAHAEITGEYNYEIEVCYGNFPEYLVCINTTGSCSGDYSMEVLSLSNYTNAHIGDYDTNICCRIIECRPEVVYCSHYDEGGECSVDPCDVADESVEANNPDITCGEGYFCYCEWNKTRDKCGPRWDAIDLEECGNDKIDSGETCDGTDWGNITGCTSFDDFTGGSLSCVACEFDTSLCTGIPGICGDSVINPGETCDNNSLSNKTCADFGLCEDGGLACYPVNHTNNCTFDTTGCVSCGGTPSKIGKCNYAESTDDNCDDGFLTYNWTATWTWDSENIGSDPPCEDNYVLDDGKCYYDPNGASKKCIGGSNTVPCPAQIQLPFFGSYSIVVIIALIVLIYIFLTLKKKGKKSKIFRLFSKK